MTALQTKLWRDLSRLRIPMLTIALVVAIGVAGFVGMFAVHDSLTASRDAFYRDNRLADLFASVRRAPVGLAERLREVPGVAELQWSVTFDAQVNIAQVVQPVTGRFIGIDLAQLHAGRQGLNALTLRTGRWPERSNTLEAVVSDRFAAVRKLQPGDVVDALLNGRLERVHVVGTAVTPEYVFASKGGAPDDASFGIWWVDRQRLIETFDMNGAFNKAAIRLHPGTAEPPVIDALDRLLEPYGGVGVVGRDRMLSAKIVDNELSQLKVMGTVLPAIFLAVAMFMLSIVLSRQVATQRGQIAALKALGYGDGAITWHYLQIALITAGLGVLAGLGLSQLIGRSMLGLYAEMFRFGHLRYATQPGLVLAAGLIAALAASAGAWSAIHAVIRLRPAQAMAAPTPPVYTTTPLERLGWVRKMPTGTRMVIRNLQRRPIRAALTVLGVGLAVALQISGAFWLDTIKHIIDLQFRQVQQGDVLINFHRPVAPSVLFDLKRLPGVLGAEVYRTEPVKVTLGNVSKNTAVLAFDGNAQRMRVVDDARGAVPLPPDGVVLSGLLAAALGARIGDTVQVQFSFWSQRMIEVTVVDIVHTLFGQLLYMHLDALNQHSGDGDGVTDAALSIDPQQKQAFWSAIKAAPLVNSVFDKADSLAEFNQRTSKMMGVFSQILTAFAITMAIGITYNAARIALSERAWELASLRVLGMSRAEVSALLLSELLLEVVIALPVGIVLGWQLATVMMQLMSSDAIDFPVVIERSTYASAVLIVLAASVASALLVRRQIDQLDLVSVLKVRE